MAGAYTRQFQVLTLGASMNAIILHVPAGRVWVIRDISFSGWGDQLSVLYLVVNSGSQYGDVFHSELQPGENEHWEGRVAMEAGNDLYCDYTGNGARLLITGYDLSA